jgi:hypothetical protein
MISNRPRNALELREFRFQTGNQLINDGDDLELTFVGVLGRMGGS